MPGSVGRRELRFNECSISVGEGAEVLEMGGGDGCTALGMYLTPLNCTLKIGEEGKFYVTSIL